MFNTLRVEPSPFAHRSIAADSGFTAADLTMLSEVHSTAITQRWWRQGQMISQEFAQYFAGWTSTSVADGPPSIVLARFKKTGTYALIIDATVVATAATLGGVLPALLARADGGPAAAG